MEHDHTMMESLRTAANSLILKIIFGIIIASFVLTGSNYLISGTNDYVAKVNGQEISRWEFENFFSNEQKRMLQLETQLSESETNGNYIKFLRQQTLERLINNVLLDQYAKKLGLRSSNDQVKKMIFSTQAFQINGKFDNRRFNEIINQMGINPDQYAQALHRQISIQQLINGLLGTEFILKKETDELISLVLQQRIIREATIDVNMIAAKQEASDDEIKAYYEQNKNSFMEPKQFRVSYIKLDAADMLNAASEREIQSYYDQHQDQFIQKQRNRYSIIQTQTEADAKAILEKLENGGDFVVIAKAKSTDIISAKNGGDMGWMEETNLPEELKNAALKHKGQLSGIIRSSVGFLIAKLNDIQPEKIKPLTEVYDEIADEVKWKKALSTFSAVQQKIRSAINNNRKSLADLEEVTGVKAVETDWFDRNCLPQELNFKPVVDAIFSDSLSSKNDALGSNVNIISVDSGRAFVLSMIGFKLEAIKPLDSIKEQIAELVKHNKAEQQATINAKKLLAELKVGKEDEVLKTAGLNFTKPKTLSRTVLDPISQAVFRLKPPLKDRPSYGVASNIEGNIVLLALDQVKLNTIPEDQKREMMEVITQHKRQILFEALIDNLRKKSKIKLGNVVT